MLQCPRLDTPLRELMEEISLPPEGPATKSYADTAKRNLPRVTARTTVFKSQYLVADTPAFYPSPRKDLKRGSPWGSPPCCTLPSVTTLVFLKEQLGSNLRTESGLSRVSNIREPDPSIIKEERSRAPLVKKYLVLRWVFQLQSQHLRGEDTLTFKVWATERDPCQKRK